MIEAWDVGPPRSSARARTRRGSRRAASTGESSSATRIEPRGSSAGPGPLPVGQVRGDLARDVGDVGLALPHGRRVRGGEALPELARHLGQGPFRVDPLAADALDDRAEVGLVERDQAVRLEDRGQLRAHVALGLARVPREVLGGARRPPGAGAAPPSRTPRGRRRGETPGGRPNRMMTARPTAIPGETERPWSMAASGSAITGPFTLPRRSCGRSGPRPRRRRPSRPRPTRPG